MINQTDVVIVGAGIVGLAHAYHAARTGLSVTVFERSAQATGASTQNFGMLALVAQAEGRQRKSALRSLSHWQEVAGKAGIALHQSGCLFLAREQAELKVLEEFVKSREEHNDSASKDRCSQTMLRHADLSRFIDLPGDNTLLGGMLSDDAWKLDQRTALAKLSLWLQREYGVIFHFGTEVKEVSDLDDGMVEVHAKQSNNTSVSSVAYRSNHAIICSGSEFRTLYPEFFTRSGISHCELQMLRTVAQPETWQLQPFILGGLSLSRYSAFESCDSLPELINLQRAKYGAYLDHGIHLIICQEADGSVTIGDSHRYGIPDSPEPASGERSSEVDELMLNGVAELIALPDIQIAERWSGRYAHLPDNDILTLKPSLGVTLVTVTNGQGMTHAFALAEDILEEITADKPFPRALHRP